MRFRLFTIAATVAALSVTFLYSQAPAEQPQEKERCARRQVLRHVPQ